jgi:hypothetical protein
MAMMALLLALAASSTQPTNALIEYRRCLMGNRLDDRPQGSPLETMAAAIAKCAARRENALSFLHSAAPHDGEARNKANLELVEQELSLVWYRARSEFELSVHHDRWGPNGACLP